MMTENEAMTETVVSLTELPPKVTDARRKKGALMVIALWLSLFVIFYLIGRYQRSRSK